MARDLTSGMSTALAASIIRPVLIGRLDIETDPVVAWTGPGIFAPTGTGDSALDGQTFLPLAPFISMSAVTEGQATDSPVTLTLSGHDLDEDLLVQIVRDRRTWRGRSAWLWLGLLNTDESTVVADPVRIKSGVITGITTMREESGATVQVTIDIDLGKAFSAPFRWVDHTRIFSADTFSTYIRKLVNKPQGLTDTDVVNNSGGGDSNNGSGMRLY